MLRKNTQGCDDRQTENYKNLPTEQFLSQSALKTLRASSPKLLFENAQ